MAAEVGHPFADAAEPHTLGSPFRAAFCFRRRHAFALIFDLQPYLLIGERQRHAGAGAIGMPMHVCEALLQYPE